jgi:cytochrome c oxidase subunit 3
MFLTIIGGGIFVGSQVWNGKFLLETKGSLLSLLIRSSCRSSDFAVNLHERAVNPDKAKWFMGEGSYLVFSVAEVQAGFKSHPDILTELF